MMVKHVSRLAAPIGGRPKKGQCVRRGEKVGVQGRTGFATGDHVDLEFETAPVDPVDPVPLVIRDSRAATVVVRRGSMRCVGRRVRSCEALSK